MLPKDSGWPKGGPRILAIDTSTERAGIALSDGSAIFSRSWDAGRTQTTSVLPIIDALLTESGLSPSKLGAIAIAMGPGTFTGLRVGMSLAKGLVLACDIPLIGIPTLDIAAAGAGDADNLIAVLPAGRGRVVWQRYGMHAEPNPHNTTVPELIDALAQTPDALLIGEMTDLHRPSVEEHHRLVRWQHRDPEILLRLAKARLDAGELDDPVTLEPRYLHGVTVSAGPVQDRLKRKPDSNRP